MDCLEVVLEVVGFSSSILVMFKLEIVLGFVCDICCEDEFGLEIFVMKCGY